MTRVGRSHSSTKKVPTKAVPTKKATVKSVQAAANLQTGKKKKHSY